MLWLFQVNQNFPIFSHLFSDDQFWMVAFSASFCYKCHWNLFEMNVINERNNLALIFKNNQYQLDLVESCTTQNSVNTIICHILLAFLSLNPQLKLWIMLAKKITRQVFFFSPFLSTQILKQFKFAKCKKIGLWKIFKIDSIPFIN